MDKDCPCDAVRELKKIVERHDNQLGDGKVQFAVINTKLNVVIAVFTTIGVALCGILVKYLFGF